MPTECPLSRGCRRVLREEEEADPVLYWLLHVLLRPLVRVVHNPKVEGLAHVPEHGPAILASNHLSFSDSIFLPLALPRRITFPAKMEYFTKPGIKGKLTKAFFKGTGQIPIDRSGGNASDNALQAGLDVLGRGDLFGIYPEGTRSPDGRLHRGKTGVARLALEGRVSVIPVAMIDTDKFQPTGQLIPNLSKVGIRFGPPLDFSRYQDRANDRVVLRTITDEIMRELARLSGREYVDEYAAVRKVAIAAKAQEIVAKSAAKAEEMVAAGRERVDTVTAKAETIVAATKERTQHRIGALSGGGWDRAFSVAEDPRDISPLRAFGLIPRRGGTREDDVQEAAANQAGPSEEGEDPFGRQVPASAEQLAMQDEDDGLLEGGPTSSRAF